MEPITVKYKVLDPPARTPAYATSGSAAADLCAVLDEPLTVQPMQRVLVPTGLAIDLPGAHMEKMEHDAFMDRARAAYAVVQTGETALYGNIIIRKGVVRL